MKHTHRSWATLGLLALLTAAAACTATPTADIAAAPATAIPYTAPTNKVATSSTSSTATSSATSTAGGMTTISTTSSGSESGRASTSGTATGPAHAVSTSVGATGTTIRPPRLTAAPGPPRLTALPEDYTSPQTVAAAYFAAWCWRPIASPANSNLAVTAQWVTAAGWDDDKARGVTDDEWALIVTDGTSRACGPVTVTVQAQTDRTHAWVVITAQQIEIRGGKIAAQYEVSQRRRVLLADDGRWLVDVQVQAN